MRGLLLAGGLLAMAACGTGDDEAEVQPGARADTGSAVAGAAATPDPAAAALAGVRWVLVSVGGTPAQSLEPARHPFIEFDAAGGRAGGNSSCNRFSGPFAATGDSLAFGPLVSTKMACIDPALNAQETAFLGALAEVTRWRMAGDTLVLGGPAGDLVQLVAARDTLAVR